MSVKNSVGSFDSSCPWLRFLHITLPLIHST